MKKTTFFRKGIALFLTLMMLLSVMPLSVFADSSEYTCSSYEDCSADGCTPYVIVNDNCPIREEAHNGGAIRARGTAGQMIRVSDVFYTLKLARWCRIETDDPDDPLYIHIDNCVPHTTHSYITVMDTDSGYIEFCQVCGLAKAVAGGEVATCDLTCVTDQVVLGSFSEYNPSFTSIAAQMIVGEIPGVGTVADARDLVGDIAKGEPAWVIGLDLAAFLPLVGMFKYGDELGYIAKRVDAPDIPWGKWNDYSKATINGTEYAEIGDFYYTKHAVDEFLNPSIETNQINGIEHSRGVVPSYVNWVLTDGVRNGSTTIVENGANRVKYCNGSLEVIVENGNIVVTIITK